MGKKDKAYSSQLSPTRMQMAGHQRKKKEALSGATMIHDPSTELGAMPSPNRCLEIRRGVADKLDKPYGWIKLERMQR